MVKHIDTLVEDIYGVLENGFPEGFDLGQIPDFGSRISDLVISRFGSRDEVKPTLRMSNIGTPCNRKLWYTINRPEEKEPFRPEVLMKFFFGDILEELLLFLAEVAGHKVEGRQDEQEIQGVKGHRDAVIDGMLVDVKSASTYSFNKFKNHELEENDPFGYIDQLQSYLHTAQDDPIVTIKDRAGFLVIDKTLGHICLDIHKKKDFPIEKLYEYKKEMVSREEPPARRYDPEPEGKSGNLKLGLQCSYCDFKRTCFPTLRTFLYSNKPVHLVHVEREPKVPELNTSTSTNG